MAEGEEGLVGAWDEAVPRMFASVAVSGTFAAKPQEKCQDDREEHLWHDPRDEGSVGRGDEDNGGLVGTDPSKQPLDRAGVGSMKYCEVTGAPKLGFPLELEGGLAKAGEEGSPDAWGVMQGGARSLPHASAGLRPPPGDGDGSDRLDRHGDEYGARCSAAIHGLSSLHLYARQLLLRNDGGGDTGWSTSRSSKAAEGRNRTMPYI